jgi:hypothetical protein
MRGWSRAAAGATALTFALLLAGSGLAATITNFTPTTDFIPEDPGKCVGTQITINGTGFVNDGGTPVVQFNGKPAVDVAIGSDRVIYARMPVGASPGNITVTTPAGTATSPLAFTVAYSSCAPNQLPTLTPASSAKAAISRVSPASGKAGTKLTITGSALTTATAVKIGGAKAAFTVVSPTKIKATVPAKAKSGKITVTTTVGTATSSTVFTRK